MPTSTSQSLHNAVCPPEKLEKQKVPGGKRRHTKRILKIDLNDEDWRSIMSTCTSQSLHDAVCLAEKLIKQRFYAGQTIRRSIKRTMKEHPTTSSRWFRYNRSRIEAENSDLSDARLLKCLVAEWKAKCDGAEMFWRWVAKQLVAVTLKIKLTNKQCTERQFIPLVKSLQKPNYDSDSRIIFMSTPNCLKDMKIEPNDDFDDINASSITPTSHSVNLAEKVKKQKVSSGKIKRRVQHPYRKRRPLTPYATWCREYRPRLVAENPGIGFHEVTGCLSATWLALSDEEKMAWCREHSPGTNSSTIGRQMDNLWQLLPDDEKSFWKLKAKQWLAKTLANTVTIGENQPEIKPLKKSRRKQPKRKVVRMFEYLCPKTLTIYPGMTLLTESLNGISRSGRVRKKSEKLMELKESEKNKIRSQRKRRSSTVLTDLPASGCIPVCPLSRAAINKSSRELKMKLCLKSSIKILPMPPSVVNDSLMDNSELITAEPRLPKVINNEKTSLDAGEIKTNDLHTSFSVWYSERRASVVAENPNIRSVEITRRLGEEWHALSDEDKMVNMKFWKLKANRLLAVNSRTDGENQANDGFDDITLSNIGASSRPHSVNLTERERVHKPKVLGGPHDIKMGQTATAFILWCRNRKSTIVAENPDLNIVGISRRLGEEWKALPEEEVMFWKLISDVAKNDKTSNVTILLVVLQLHVTNVS
uniref:HMG box domain-containing protein n=1 Tax=Strigamia maritima TaxID=126957 RepID=T1IZB6_STRMM